MTTRELGLVREVLTAAGMDISYAYEDLIFLEHNGFLLQFTEKQHELLLHKNSEADEHTLAGAIDLLQLKAAETGLTLTLGTKYRLRQVAGQEDIQLEFC
ncbi:MAG: hypothetical protein L3J49_15235 [Desulfobulbaceae bacterium]|nr:hypothetical protein [Desulfobulbaceae bacterium]